MQKVKATVIWFTGLSGSGKSTIAQQLIIAFKEQNQKVVHLDGDDIREIFTNTAFDDEARKKHNLQVGKLAALLESQGHIVIVTLISPFAETRDEIRKVCNNFVEVYIATDLETCISRDPKGFYKRALAGEIQSFTGISSVYESPKNAEIIINTEHKTAKECAFQIINHLN